jgi:hypothetical protein
MVKHKYERSTCLLKFQKHIAHGSSFNFHINHQFYTKVRYNRNMFLYYITIRLTKPNQCCLTSRLLYQQTKEK